MSGSTFGNLFRITTWGESHGEALGVIIDGCPSNLLLCEEDIQVYLDRRKPGQTKYATPRKEADAVEILSGIFEGRTTGTPISLLVRNTSQRSHDYRDIASYYRPGHADYTFDKKYNIRDYRGGGRSSGRETVGRVAAGAVASLFLKELGISLLTYTTAIGPVTINTTTFNQEAIFTTPTCMPDYEASARAEEYLQSCIKNLDSAGGIIECRILGVPAGIGEPVFDKLDACLAKAMMSIGAVKAVEIGDGIGVSKANGSSNNDAFQCENGIVIKKSNHAGGILGGISDGSEIIIRVHIKPTPSIFSSQDTISTSLENIAVQIKGRHDPIIVPRGVVVVEAMAALTLADALMCGMSSQLDSIKNFYC